MIKSKRIQKSNNFKDQLKTKIQENFKFDLADHGPKSGAPARDSQNDFVVSVRRCGSFKIKDQAEMIEKELLGGKTVRIEGRGKLSEKAVNLLELVKARVPLKDSNQEISILGSEEITLQIVVSLKALLQA